MSDLPFLLVPSESHSIGTINQYTDIGIQKNSKAMDVVLCRLCMRFNYENLFGNCVLPAISFQRNYNSNADMFTKGYAQQNAKKKHSERAKQTAFFYLSIRQSVSVSFIRRVDVLESVL